METGDPISVHTVSVAGDNTTIIGLPQCPKYRKREMKKKKKKTISLILSFWTLTAHLCSVQIGVSAVNAKANHNRSNTLATDIALHFGPMQADVPNIAKKFCECTIFIRIV